MILADKENTKMEEEKEVDTREAEGENTQEEKTASEETGGEEKAETAGAEEEKEAAPAQEQEAAKDKDRKFFGKKKEKKDKKDEKIEELTDKLTRQMAEFDNYRKRTEKEKTGMYVVGAKDVVEKILPVVDNFERGLATAKDAEDPFVEGMNKIYKQFTTVLSDMGVSVIEAVGKEFDPNLHNAVMHVEDESVGENIIVEEFQKGYIYKDMVVRHSMVKVAN
ncbi:MAG TPA: nucleotide exchange factor GrpE [Candidatus Scatomonas pullistercoris]|uniref:Protein GrpE n=1 Tax=Candidatus Scatomonas pullistercoris TaxID=2840920 RepID=A0A9D1P2V6_9FIRM|nr:nucleotide exchange factor GrpE [Candidatus Scatomonas pullistercoris]